MSERASSIAAARGLVVAGAMAHGEGTTLKGDEILWNQTVAMLLHC